MKYPKIETLFERDSNFKCIPGAFRDVTVAALRNLDWVWTEKLGGMTIRILWDGEVVKFAGLR